MAEKLPHLPLPEPESFIRKKRIAKFGYQKAERDTQKFYQTEIKKLDFIGDSYKKDKQIYSKYFNPNLIFKIKLRQKSISDKIFRVELNRAGIKTISSAPNKMGYWVAFTDDEQFTKFRKKLDKRVSEDKATFVDVIDGIDEIPPQEKIGELLKENPLKKPDVEYLDVEIWRMDDSSLNKFIDGLTTLIEENHGEISDRLVTDNFCVIRVKMDHNLFDKIINMREISHVDRPPRISIEKQLTADIEKLNVKGPPPADKPGILIIDSGIRNHPLLQDAIADRIALPTTHGEIKEDRDIDDVGHGTQVAGIALYGDIDQCIKSSTFDPQLWLYSAKVMFRNSDGHAVFDEKELLEHQFKDAVEKTIEKHDNCKVINISLGNSAKKMYEGQRQFRLASLIDELSFKHSDILFTISAGNNMEDVKDHESYPNYLMENSLRVKIIDPATSVHALTTGSIFLFNSKNSSSFDFPSPFTRVGPGLNGMIKPELVEYGGGYSSDLITINPNWTSEGRLFTLDKGTSFSSPKIAHYLAKLKDALPSVSRNLIKALLLSSASIPDERPEPLNEIKLCGKNKDVQNILNIYGYGKPKLDDALYSQSNRVLLTHDGKIQINKVHFFPINLPDEFLNEKGKKSIEITLAFDPPINSNRVDYLGATMEFHIFKDSSIENIRRSYSETQIQEDDEDIVPEAIKNKEIKLVPGINIRKKGTHQKAVKEWIKQPKFKTSEPLVLAVVCQKKWYEEKNYEQSYAVIATFKHEQQIDLYNLIRLRNQARVRIR
jgi:hypothetical protein